jgi:nucleoid-associated protein YgaU
VTASVSTNTPSPSTLSTLVRGNENTGNRRPPSTATTEPKTHVVLPGETLYGIAEKYYGDSTHWKKIRDANKTLVDPTGRIRAGQVLIIP